MIIKLCTLDGVSRRKDRSISIRLSTASEQSINDLSELDGMFQKTVLLAIKEESTPFLDSEINDLDNVDLDLEDTSKTPSKRLRDVLYVMWEQNKEGVFKDFYKTKMNVIIEHFKNKL